MSPNRYRIRIDVVSSGTIEGAESIVHVNVGGGTLPVSFFPNSEIPTTTIIQPSAAQIQGLNAYIACIGDGTNTAAVEAALTGIV